MASNKTEKTLRCPTNREALENEKRYLCQVSRGAYLCYRKNVNGIGSWSARLRTIDNRYTYQNIGEADDNHNVPNGQNVLDYFQAIEKVRQIEKEFNENQGLTQKDVTVKMAVQDYLTNYQIKYKGIDTAKSICSSKIVPKLGKIELTKLVKNDIENWLYELALSPKPYKNDDGTYTTRAPRTDNELRARKETANRALATLKALLNRAYSKGFVISDKAWKHIEPFRNTSRARTRYLTPDEALKLLDACKNNRDFQKLVSAALFTGGRYGEIINLRVKDFDKTNHSIQFTKTKNNKPRSIPLNNVAYKFFENCVQGKDKNSYIFTYLNNPWSRTSQNRFMTKACLDAKINPPICFHELRHSYASNLALNGVELFTISKLLGHCDTRMTEKHYAHLANQALINAVNQLDFQCPENPPPPLKVI